MCPLNMQALSVFIIIIMTFIIPLRSKDLFYKRDLAKTGSKKNKRLSNNT